MQSFLHVNIVEVKIDNLKFEFREQEGYWRKGFGEYSAYDRYCT